MKMQQEYPADPYAGIYAIQKECDAVCTGSSAVASLRIMIGVSDMNQIYYNNLYTDWRRF
jgi:hypothetical protein